ncbi:MAG TPA: hypothetical protein DIT76_09565 [Spartobacteria bacterium]|jgi:hypothetical protein|nr:hypothetical protein [Spartobacteria bacterium]HCP92271.1 hypothetical protein [Spartobacteria bacterium]
MTKDRIRQKITRACLLGLVLLLGGYLRSVGLTWGLESGYGHMRNFQPDEFISMRGVLQLDLVAGKFTAPGAYFEGTFNYYLWALPVTAVRLFDTPKLPPSRLTDDAHFRLILHLCRLMSVAFDVLATWIVFLAALEATSLFYPALLAAFFYTIIPMQVIYAHFMRTHVLSNLLCALVLWLSLKSLKKPEWWLLLTLGLISGLAAATHYPMGIIVTIPCLYFLFRRSDTSISWIRNIIRSAVVLLSGPIWWIGLGFLGGLFVGEPPLFINPRSVLHAISTETFNYVPSHAFALTGLFDLSRLWNYLSVLIPFGMYPWLWIIAYGAILYLCFRPRLYPLSVPILIFFLLYLYPMAKGYSAPLFARAAMLLFPGFAVLVALAWQDLALRRVWPPVLSIFSVGAAAAIFIPSLVFDWAYVREMQRIDVRTAMHYDLKRVIGNSTVTIGVEKLPGNFYTVMPAVDSLKGPSVSVQLQNSNQEADFFVLGRSRPITWADRQATIRSVEKNGKFKCENVYMNQPRIFQHPIDLSRFPPDMTYPFPTLLLFQAHEFKARL